MPLPEMLQFAFMQRALIAGMIIGLLCPVIGIFLVLRRLSMIGDSLSHVALAGVASGILADTYPLGAALVFTVLAAFAIEQLRKIYTEHAELVLAIVLSAGIGTAVVLLSLARGLTVDLFSYLFGSITLVLPRDLQIMGVLGAVILLSVRLLYRKLFYIAFNEEGARVAGIPVHTINLYFMVMAAATITISMRIVGVLLVSSLMVVPVASALQIAGSFRQAMYLSVLYSQAAVITGIFASYYLELASGGTIVLLAVGMLLATLGAKRIRKMLAQSRARTTPSSHG